MNFGPFHPANPQNGPYQANLKNGPYQAWQTPHYETGVPYQPIMPDHTIEGYAKPMIDMNQNQRNDNGMTYYTPPNIYQAPPMYGQPDINPNHNNIQLEDDFAQIHIQERGKSVSSSLPFE